MTSRVVACLVLGVSSLASAEEPPVQFDAGINARQFSLAPDEMVAFRTINPEEAAPRSGVTVSLRFTRTFPFRTFVGLEAETGTLDTQGSNLAGAYAVGGVRGDLGRIMFGAELAAGRRWMRYSVGMDDESTHLLEPRVRADIWLNPRWTLGGAVGSTLSGNDVWMAGVYLGVHSLPFGGTRRGFVR